MAEDQEQTPVSTIAEALQAQRARIHRAAELAGRDPQEITLIAVSKKQSVQAIVEAYAAGQRDFGENYVQELVEKAEQLAMYADIRWHMIGHLQSNKARFVAGLVHRVHTVSSVKLAKELAHRVRQRGATVAASPEATRARGQGQLDTLPPIEQQRMGVLVEVNVSGEASKSGCSAEELPEILQAIEADSYLQLRGLMTMPPYDPQPERALPHFQRLSQLRKEHGGPERLPELSMGMSHDAEQAILAGATSVRIGTAIFGARPTQV